MGSFARTLLHPFVALNLLSEEDTEGEGIDVIYVVTFFLAVGIWTVVKRHLNRLNSAVDFDYPAEKPADHNWKSIFLANPSLKAHESDSELLPANHLSEKRYITSYDPATGQHIGTFLADDEVAIAGKVLRARDAQKSWANTTFRERRRVIRSLNKWLVENQDVCARTACRDTGKTLIDAALGEILTTCSKMEWLMKHGEKVLSPESRRSNTLLSYKKSEVHYEPLGVVAGIVSWNYPLHNSWSPILAAIFAGNGIVLKCSEQVVWSSIWFVGAIQHCLQACGHDPDLVQLVCCWPEQANALTTNPLIRHITFIGSETVGRKVAIAAAEHLTPVCMELGGKDPAVILPDTDLEKYSSIWMRGVYQNMGQNCIGLERIIVHESQHDELFDILRKRVEKLRTGSVLTPLEGGFVPTVDVGSMISNDRFDALQAVIENASEKGAVVEGGAAQSHPYHENGLYFKPTLVGHAKPEMDIAQEELFAPVALLIPYKDVEEAIDIANGTRYGLGASVWGPVQRECVEVAKRLECGMVSVNDFAVFYLNQDLPFGGVKSSGYGRFGGPEGLRALCNTKALVVDRFPLLIQTSIPKALDYPVRSLVQSWEFVTGLVDMVYGDSYRARLRGIVRLVRAARKH